MISKPLLQTDLKGITPNRGKVRDIYDLGDDLLIVATDRISAFDVVMANGIPNKGVVLTQISEFWFKYFEGSVKHHMIEVIRDQVPSQFFSIRDQLFHRTMRVKKCQPLAIEAVVRGYLAGSGWKDYQRNGSVCGVSLPPGLKQCQQLEEPIFTPATKAPMGDHDENISFEQACQIVGTDAARHVRDRSLEIYRRGHEYASERGIILADTKFEWGLLDDEIVLIDELLTPDSSRFWPAEAYEPGRDQESFDKQFVRNYLESINYNKQPPGPELPAEIIQQTAGKYAEAFEIITGSPLAV